MSDTEPTPDAPPEPEEKALDEAEFGKFVRGCLQAGQPDEDDSDE